MAIAKLSQTINKPVQEVFATVTTVTNFPQWNPTTKSARKLTDGEVGNGTKFEMSIRGFGKQELVLEEYERNKQVRLIPISSMIHGGHRFIFMAEGDKTRIDHELEMKPKGLFKLFGPLMGVMARKNLSDTAKALQEYLEGQ
jgi:ligand-binding SRPBCC domain-containing protein